MLPSAVLGLSDIFKLCNDYCRQENEARIHYTYVGINTQITLGDVMLKVTPISKLHTLDTLIIPPIIGTETLTVHQDLIAWLISMYHHGTQLSAACKGSFILAQTGLLDYKKATTHWLLESPFKTTYPKVILETHKLIIDEGDIITAGGVTAYLDLALYHIEKQLSSTTANLCASLLLVDRGRDSQQCYKDLSQIVMVEDKEFKTLITWIEKNLHQKLNTNTLAKKMRLEPRSFLRRFKKALHTTPKQYLQSLRVEAAKKLLVTTTMSFDAITYEVGFLNESSFRRLFKRETALNPGEYRSKFKGKSHALVG